MQKLSAPLLIIQFALSRTYVLVESPVIDAFDNILMLPREVTVDLIDHSRYLKEEFEMINTLDEVPGIGRLRPDDHFIVLLETNTSLGANRRECDVRVNSDQSTGAGDVLATW